MAFQWLLDPAIALCNMLYNVIRLWSYHATATLQTEYIIESTCAYSMHVDSIVAKWLV